MGGLLPLAMGLFHQQEPIRDLVVELLDVLRSSSVCRPYIDVLYGLITHHAGWLSVLTGS
jgi:hypothetical protein